MMKCSRLNTMETFKNGFSIERDGKVYTLTEEEMFDFRFLDNAVDGQSYLDVYHNDADEDEADVIDLIRNDEEICYNISQSVLDAVTADTGSIEHEICQKYIKANRNKDWYISKLKDVWKMENEIKWEVVEELSNEDGTPNCWAYKIGKANYVYITHNHNDMYDVEHSTSYGESRIVVLKTFKGFSNAKRFAEQWILNNYEI